MEKIKVENRSGKYLVTSIPNTNITFVWVKQGSFVMLTKEEIKELYYQPGGKLFFDNLIVHDDKLCAELFGNLEPEYFYTEKEIDEILLNGSIEQLEDALDFSPAGGVDLIATRAVELKIPDINKRQVITKFTGRDIDANIELYSGEENKEEVAMPVKKQRRTAPINTSKEIKIP